MDTAYDRMKAITADPAFLQMARTAFYRLEVQRDGGAPLEMLDDASRRYGLAGEVSGVAVVLYLRGSRARHPACIVLSPNRGQHGSTSCSSLTRTEHCLIQIFEGDADDTAVADDCTLPTHRVETKGRVLLH